MTGWACLDTTDVGLTRLARWALAPFVSSLVLDLPSWATFLIVSMLVAVVATVHGAGRRKGTGPCFRPALFESGFVNRPENGPVPARPVNGYPLWPAPFQAHSSEREGSFARKATKHVFIRSRLARFVASSVMFLVVIQPVVAQTVGEPLPPWSAGYLDIHFINTGRGECSFLVLPDGTTLLVDAGDSERSNRRIAEPRPDASRTPAAWIGRYITHMLSDRKEKAIDYAMLSHFHTDHMGIVEEGAGPPAGAYPLFGIAEVAEYVQVRKMIDRAWPEYDYPEPLMNSRTMVAYRRFLQAQIERHKLQVERFRPGVNDQITLCHEPDAYPDFEIRNVAANGEVWTGVGTSTRHHIPPIEFIPELDKPSENLLSIVFRLSYGSFDYYTGGDLAGIPDPGAPAWHDLESPVGSVVGPVDVSELNHHGYLDAQNPFFVASLRARVYILQARSASHPSPQTLERLFSSRLYPGPRDVFATNMMEATRIVLGHDAEKLKSDQGHIVVRVERGGAEYRVIILDDSAELFRIKAAHGPYRSR